MTDYLADVVMPTEPERPLPLTDEVIQEQLDIEEKEQAEMEITEEPEDDIPEPVRKPKIPQEEMFEPPRVKTILDPQGDPPEPKGKKTRKKRGPASAEQLERLARGRAKAAENRIIKKRLKEEQKEKDRADKELVEKYRERERLKLKKQLETPLDEELQGKPQIIEKEKIVEKGYSQAQLDEAVQRAVEQSVNRVETLRKQRKEIKKKAEAKAKHDAVVFKEVNRALKTSAWDHCFI